MQPACAVKIPLGQTDPAVAADMGPRPEQLLMWPGRAINISETVPSDQLQQLCIHHDGPGASGVFALVRYTQTEASDTTSATQGWLHRLY